ncbi:tetratricopeptide repeat protein [Chromobacterium alticapitis]|uniref:Sel1 repeat family protein n=1 Tax=Chromobacterium alticapitis TaxID=2073169 RepID=A0A2S5DEP5_9NEIS|nr:tetratricopeptide repeat protein [Chromobacterium alticapitis]POZ61447.1 sel1 repeat family protein [Chromobacterium alticapitis]
MFNRNLIPLAALCLALLGCAGRPSQAQLDEAKQQAVFAGDAAAWSHLVEWAGARNPAAALSLAEAYAAADTPKGWAQAAPWLQRAAEWGSGPAAFRLARLYAKGVGVAASRAQSSHWLHVAAERENPGAACVLGLRAKEAGDMSTAHRWFEQAAAGGSAEAMFQLGIAYQEGQGVKADIARARGWYEKAARLEMPAALQTLAMAYQSGDLGLPRDEIKASELFNLTAHAIHDFESEVF